MADNSETARKFALGGFSCMVAALVTNPIDMVKVRLQLHGELSGKQGNAGLVSAGLKIVRTEGVTALYKGLTASLLREGTYSTLRMGFYEPIRDFLHIEGKGKDVPVYKKIIAGATSGMLGSAIANPTDLIKVRMQASETQKYRNVLDAFKIIVREEGIAGLYRGVVPTTQRAAILTASQLPAYDQSKQWLLKYGFNEGFRVHVIASMIAGLVCATTTSPIDLVKSRYMNQQFEKGRGVKYVSLWDCIIKTVKYEGFRGLYKGWLPNWLRIGPHTIVTFVVYEKCREVFGIKPI